MRNRLLASAQAQAAAATLANLEHSHLLDRLAAEVAKGNLSIYQALDEIVVTEDETIPSVRGQRG
jgi:hypothetical protein